MRIGILTHYDVNNQGAQLQLLAMYRVLEQLGHTPVVLTYEKNFDYLPQEKTRNQVSLRSVPYYIKNYLFTKGPGLTLFNARKVFALKNGRKDLACAPYDSEGLDGVIIGSDEVFSIDVGCNRMMYGHGLKAPAIAYAPSFGMATEQSLTEHGCYETVAQGLKDMYRLSARDAHTRELILSLTGREAPLVCDPVMLYRGGYDSRPKALKKPYLLIYAYDRHMVDPEEIRALKAYAKKHGLLTVSAGTYHGWCDKNIVCSARDWYGYFAGASCVVTDTFHGTVAAICNGANFATLVRKKINARKLTSLLAQTNLAHRELGALTEAELERVLSQPVDCEKVNARRGQMIESSMAYLTEALENIPR